MSQFQVNDDEESHIRLLKHDFHAMSYEEKMGHWKACSATRMNNIKDNEKTTKRIIDVWPQYKAPDGFRLVWNIIFPYHFYSTTYLVYSHSYHNFFQIELDFEYLHGKNSGLLDNIGQFCDLMLGKVFPARLKDIKGDDKILFDEVVEKRREMSEGTLLRLEI